MSEKRTDFSHFAVKTLTIPANNYNMIFDVKVLYCELQAGHSTQTLLRE